MRYIGTGTQESPIALDDSEDEVLQELYGGSLSPTEQFPSHQGDIHAPAETSYQNNHPEQRPAFPEKKRKREHSFSSQDPANHRALPPRTHASLVTRLSQPESKKARKRRRKLERQAQEEARLRNINWLNNAHQFALPSAYPTASGSGWSPELHAPHYSEPSYLPYSSASSSSSMVINDVPPRAYPMFQDDQGIIDSYDPSSMYHQHYLPTAPERPSLTSDWVSSMAMAAESSVHINVIQEQLSRWSPLSPQTMLPPTQPPPVNNATRSTNISTPKHVEHHALPAKPPPSQVIPSIGVKPDPDPNSKHGIFHITETMKDAGSDVKYKISQYIPNPARTLVMEQLPKTHRNADFINKWSRSACGSLPVHIFIDGSIGKALIEFATAELARKAWASPKLGSQYSGLKPHQLKGKPREDLIKVWWYRVDGVGANSGVGEIEEGEIEGDYGDKETEALSAPPKETKKERKARLAKERAIKNKARELENKVMKERAAQEQPLGTASQLQMPLENPPVVPSKPPPSTSIPPPSSIAVSRQIPLTNHVLSLQSQANQRHLPPHPSSWVVQQHHAPVNHPLNKTAYGSSIYRLDPSTHDDDESIASSAARSPSPPPQRAYNQENTGTVVRTASRDDEDDYEEVDMDVDLDDEVVIPPSVTVALPPPPPPLVRIPPPPPPVVAPPPVPLSVPSRPPLHSSLPPRPTPLTTSFSNQKHVHMPLSQSSVLAPSFVPKNQAHASQHQMRSQVTSNTPPNKPPNNNPIQTQHVAQAKPQSTTTSSQASMSNISSIASLPMAVACSESSVPSEPKAMKNAPTEPSYTKRSLLARQKELEERIAKSKTELANSSLSKRETLPATSTPPAPVSDVSAKPAIDLGEKQAMEDRLRKLVLQSRNSKGISKVDEPKSQPGPIPTATIPSPFVPEEETTTTSSSSFSASSNSISLEDLAVSFITQTIDTIKSQPVSAPPPPKPAPQLQQGQSSVKDQLAAKQKRLEQHIAESKSLMVKFAKCTTKSEKDEMLKIMREHTRRYEEDTKAVTLLPTPSTSSNSSTSSISTHSTNYASSSVTQKTQSAMPTQQVCLPRWPVSQLDAGVLILSDDDDFEEDED